MPHQCVKCSHVYEDDESAVMHGCSCGAKAFFFLKCQHKEALELPEIRAEIAEVTTDGGEEVIEDTDCDGKYELDLNALFGRKTIVHQNDEGKYDIDLEESFRRHVGK